MASSPFAGYSCAWVEAAALLEKGEQFYLPVATRGACSYTHLGVRPLHFAAHRPGTLGLHYVTKAKPTH